MYHLRSFLGSLPTRSRAMRCASHFPLYPALGASYSTSCNDTAKAPLQATATSASGVSCNPRILITGALGQIGSELCLALREKYGIENVIATDIQRTRPRRGTCAISISDQGPFHYLDVQNRTEMLKIAMETRVDWLIHNTSIMSVKGEQHPELALDVNINGTRNALEVARNLQLRVFIPSTIAVYGPATLPKEGTDDDAKQDPSTVYGITKVFLEQLGNYYYQTHRVDFRSLRYPGILSHRTLPGGGTTDYAIHMILQAVRQPTSTFVCGLKPDQPLPMMYMSDCLAATMQLLEAPPETFPADAQRRVYNVTSMSFTPQELHTALLAHAPDFKVQYAPNHLQKIAETWPGSLNDTRARKDWGWSPSFNLEATVADMFHHFSKREL